MPEIFDVAIIGAGPGGLGAATNAAAHKMTHILFEKGEIANTIYDYQLHKHVMAEPSKLPLRAKIDFKEGSREQILDSWSKSLAEYSVNVRKSEVTGIKKDEDGLFSIKAANGGDVRAKNVVLSIGVQGSPRKLGVPGEDLPHVAYTLADPGAFEGQDIFIIGAGDSAIENALALAEKNTVSLVNRQGEFARAKDANNALILSAIKSGKIRCFYNATVSRVESDLIGVNTPSGEVTAKCNHIIARLGCILPRKFIESCGISFPNSNPAAVPSVDGSYQSNVPGLYVIGALIGYPLIKQIINQGYEVVEHILGNPIEPADQVLVDERLKHLPGNPKQNLEIIRKQLPLFRELSSPQFRELITESTVHVLKEGDLVFERNDYTDSFYNVIKGSVRVELPGGRWVEIEQGNFFGEMGLISGRRRVATIRAGEKALLLETPRKQILKLISSVESVKRAVDEAFVLRALQSSIFPDADPIFLDRLARQAKPKNFKKGDVLFREGDIGDVLYVIRKGSVKISRKNAEGVDVTQTYLAAGNYVGEMALLSEQPTPRSATVSATVACETIVIEKAEFRALLAESPLTEKSILQRVEERKVQNIVTNQTEAQGEVLDFLMKEGVADAANVLIIDSDLCVGCDNCEKACAATHNGYSRLDRKGGKSFASIQVPISCRHCENPLCMLDCPPDALTRLPDGEVMIRDSCIGCGNCEKNCPYGVIQMVYDNAGGFSLLAMLGLKAKEKGAAKAAKCDQCAKMPGGPACVRSCPTGAAMRVSPLALVERVNYAMPKQAS